MERSDPRYQAYVEILKEELIPAMGCTEPIALAYAAARAREVLGALPESVQLQVSGSIIKNVKSVIVPNTGHLKGMEAAVAAGIIAGSADRELEVISEVSEDKQAAIRDYLQTVPISIQHIEQGHVFDIIVTERSGDSYAKVRIADFHTNICLIEKNGDRRNDFSNRLQCSSISGLQKKHLYINFQIYKCFFFILFLTFLANHYYHDNEDNNYCCQINDIVHIALDHHIQTGENSKNEQGHAGNQLDLFVIVKLLTLSGISAFHKNISMTGKKHNSHYKSCYSQYHIK